MTAGPLEEPVPSPSRGPTSGAGSVGAGVLVLGVTTYVFFVLLSRGLSPDGFAGVSVVYTLLYTAGAGLLQPVEAEVGRTVASAQARAEGAGTAVARIAAACATLVTGLAVVLVVVQTAVADVLFAGDKRLVLVSAVGLLCFGATYVVRGILAGLGRFTAYSVQLGLEGAMRVLGGLALLVAGLDSAWFYALLVAVTPPVATALVCARPWTLLRSGATASWRSTANALGWLSACGVASQLLANAGPLLVAALAAPDQFAQAGRFMAALVLIRIPLFLFAAAQAVLVPSVATAMATGRWREVRRTYATTSALVAAVAVVNAVGLTVLGPHLLSALFGPDYVLGRVDLLLLGLFAAAQVHAQLSYQTLLGLGAVRTALLGWSAGLGALGLGVASVSDLLRRVEVGLVLGAVTAAVGLAVTVNRRIAGTVPS